MNHIDFIIIIIIINFFNFEDIICFKLLSLLKGDLAKMRNIENFKFCEYI